MHMIDEPSIPANAIIKVSSALPQNQISDTPTETQYIFEAPEDKAINIEQPPVEKYLITTYNTGEPYLIK